MGWRSVLLKPQVIHVDRDSSMNLRPVKPFQRGQISFLVYRHVCSISVFKEVRTDRAAVSDCTPDLYFRGLAAPVRRIFGPEKHVMFVDVSAEINVRLITELDAG